MRQFQFFAATDGDGSAEHAACILQHEVHHFGCYLLGGTYQVALVLTVFVVYDNDEFASLKVGQRLFNRIELKCIHIPYTLLYILCNDLHLTLQVTQVDDSRNEFLVDAEDMLQVFI